MLVSFNYADPTKVQDSDIIGAVTTGVVYRHPGVADHLRHDGLLLEDSDRAWILTERGCRDSGRSRWRTQFGRVALIDSPPSTPVATAISNRGATGNAFNTSSKRAVLCYPQETFYDTGIVPTGVTLSTTGAPVTAQANALAVGPYSSVGSRRDRGS